MEQRVSARKRERPRLRERATRYDTQMKAAVAAGVLFRQDLGHGGEESSSNVALECARSDQRARDRARGDRSRLRRFDRSCSWIVLIAEVDERRLASHRMVMGLVPPSERRVKGANGRRKPERDGKVVSRWRVPGEVCASGRREHSSMEGALACGSSRL
jgi:hypothetical protein